VADPKPSGKRAIELLVYAPLGLALYARDTLPSLVGVFVARGRRELQTKRTPVDRRVEQARGLGEAALATSPEVRRLVGESLDRARGLAGGALHEFLSWRNGAVDTVVATQPETTAPAAPAPPPPPGAAPASTNPSAPPGPDPTVAVESLPIPDYDELSASQVVERLDGLTPEELAAVRRYESAHRGRNTILGKIAQLA